MSVSSSVAFFFSFEKRYASETLSFQSLCRKNVLAVPLCQCLQAFSERQAREFQEYILQCLQHTLWFLAIFLFFTLFLRTLRNFILACQRQMTSQYCQKKKLFCQGLFQFIFFLPSCSEFR